MVPGQIESTVENSFEAVKFDSLFIREVTAQFVQRFSRTSRTHGLT